MLLNKNYFAKLFMMFLAFAIQAPAMGVILAIAIGHIIDIRWEWIKTYFLKKHEYQRNSESFIFLLAFYCFILGLNSKKAAKVLLREVVTDDEKQVEELFKRYVDIYIPKNFRKGVKFDEKLTQSRKIIMLNAGDNIDFFNLVESIYNDQVENASMADIEILKKIANDFSIQYNRDYQYHPKPKAKESVKEQFKEKPANKNYKSSAKREEKANYEYKPSSSSSTKSSYISAEVKDAFKVLGFNAEKPPTLIQLKQEYKKQVRKCHPDMLGGEQLSAKKTEELNQKLTKLNKSMDIAKKFLANR